MPTVADLIRQKRAFFEQNIVLVSYSATCNEGQVYEMGMEDGWCAAPGMNLGWTGIGPDSRPMNIVTILNVPTARDPKVKAYWCPYQGGSFRHAFVESAADFTFTAKMDGCTFAVGSEVPGGGRFVVHANAGGNEQAQDDMLAGADSPVHGDHGTHFLAPSAYRAQTLERNTQATTFGIRDNTGWTFESLVLLFEPAFRRIYWNGIVPV